MGKNNKIGYIVIGLLLIVAFVLSVIANNYVSDDIELTTTAVKTTKETTQAEDDTTTSQTTTVTVDINEDELVIFHNGSGSMCIEALDFFDDEGFEYTEHLTSDENFAEKLQQYKQPFDGESEGVSTSFGYYPMIFIKGRAFSGFDESTKAKIMALIQ